MRQNVAVEAALRDLEISFHTEGLKDVCIDSALADQTLGPAAAEALRNRLVDIRAADSVYDLLAGHPAAGMHDGVECLLDLCSKSQHASHRRARQRRLGQGSPRPHRGGRDIVLRHERVRA